MIQKLYCKCANHLTFYAGTEEEFLLAHTANLDVFKFKETIAYVSIRHPDGTVYAVERPGRHHHVIALMAELGKAGLKNTAPDFQGFVSNYGRVLSREEALVVAKAAKQLIQKTAPEYKLFSEDLWETPAPDTKNYKAKA